MASPLYIGSVALLLTGLVMGALGHADASFAYLGIYGPILIGLAVGVGMVGGGVSYPPAYLLLPVLIGVLIAINYYDVFGLARYGL